MSGRRGLVTGGERSGIMITVKTADPRWVPQPLEVGIDPTISDEFKEIEIKFMLQGGERKLHKHLHF